MLYPKSIATLGLLIILAGCSGMSQPSSQPDREPISVEEALSLIEERCAIDPSDVLKVTIRGGRDDDSLFKRFRCDRFESEIQTVESLIQSFDGIQRVRLENHRNVLLDVSITMPST
ncbi:hypothetical protein DFR27_2310 [Umboniibacter marinipuniceus]|uniref:Uncharacterized protein n=1 Tax=Umboniibacter marinipuniceus TaxID=569599 RepID=A0A3M0A625_9GAMM|nr:hypothetical protein DFR27_2310 [Umboniibacter marinipuniceus]